MFVRNNLIVKSDKLLTVASTQVTRMGGTTNTFRCQYRAQQPGTYELVVLFDGKHVPGSPFRVRTGPMNDAQRVTCSGEGLTGGVAGA